MATHDDGQLLVNWNKLTLDVQYLIMSKLEDEKKLEFVDDHDFSWVGPMVKTFTLNVAKEDEHFRKELEVYKRCINVTKLVVKLRKSNFEDRKHILLPFIESIADINPNLESIIVTETKSIGPSGVLLEMPVYRSNAILTSYIVATLKKNPDYDGNRIKDAITYRNYEKIFEFNPRFNFKLIHKIEETDTFERDLYDNVTVVDCHTRLNVSNLSIYEIMQMKNVETLSITVSTRFNDSIQNLLDAVSSKLKRILIYSSILYEPGVIYLPKLPTSNVTNFTYAINSPCHHYPDLRILQVKNNVLIITNRFESIPLREVVSRFLNVDTIIFEVYGEGYYCKHRSFLDFDDDGSYPENDDNDTNSDGEDNDEEDVDDFIKAAIERTKNYVWVKHIVGLTEQQLIEQVDVIRNQDGRQINLIVLHE